MAHTATLDRNAQLWLTRVKREIAERQAAGNPPHPPVGPDAPRPRFNEAMVHPDDPCQSKGYL